ncbi:hypothetical protein [Fodinicola feengrottensis]
MVGVRQASMVPRPRWLVFWSVVWTVAYGWTYVVTANGLGGAPAGWYVGLLVIGGLALVAALPGRVWRVPLVAGALALLAAMLIAIGSLGWFLLPAVVFAAFAAGMKSPWRLAQEQEQESGQD